MKTFAHVGLLLTFILSVSGTGCSDETIDVGAGGDAGADGPPSSIDAASEDASVEAAPRDAFNIDAFPIPDGPCGDCIRDRCGAQLNTCLNNPVCQAGLFCTIQMCAAGGLGDGGLGGINIPCVLGCFMGDQIAAFTAIGALTCLSMTCLPICTGGDAGVADASTPDVDAGNAPDAGADGDADTDDDGSTDPDGDAGSDGAGELDASREADSDSLPDVESDATTDDGAAPDVVTDADSAPGDALSDSAPDDAAD